MAWTLCGDRHGLKLGIVSGFRLGGRDASDWLEKTAIVEPVDPFEGGELDGFEAAPRSASMDDLGLEQPVDPLIVSASAPANISSMLASS